MPKLIDPKGLLEIGITRKQLEVFHESLGKFLGKKEKPAAEKPAKDTTKKLRPASGENRDKPEEGPKEKAKDEKAD